MKNIFIKLIKISPALMLFSIFCEATLQDATPANAIFAAKSFSHQIPSSKPKNSAEKDIFQWFRTISEVVHLISDKHYKKINFPTFIQDALKAAVPSTDPHSSFFSKESYKAARESSSGEFSGLGISIMSKLPEDDSLIIIDVIEGGPADIAGIKGGDKIVDVDGTNVKGLSSDEIVTKLRGKEGTKVKLKIIRDKKPMEITATREKIKDQVSLCYKFPDQNIYYFSLKMFAETAPKQMKKVLEEANSKKSRGIILDLRRNPGGLLEPTTIDIAGLFLDKGSLVVSTKGRDQKVVSSYYTRNNPVLNRDIPIFIITDTFTASASEILAGCLKHYSSKQTSPNQQNLLVFTVGTETFGKGSVQEVIPISNGCALKLTTMLYYLPDDVSIQAKGVYPDFLMKPKVTPEEEMKWISELYGKETSLKNYISLDKKREDEAKEKKKKEAEELNTENKEEMAKNWEERHRKSIARDTQVQAAVAMINMLSLAKKLQPEVVKTREKALEFLTQNYLTEESVKLEQVK
jgi:carboxyl-terminal processing protease